MEGLLIRINATINGASIPMETRSDFHMLHHLLGIYLNGNDDEIKPYAANNSEPTARAIIRPPHPHIETNGASNGLRPRGINPPPGERVEDYIHRILGDYPGGLTYVQLIDKMKNAGWQTSSKDPLRLIRAYVSSDKETYTKLPNGKLKLKQQSQNAVTRVSDEKDINPFDEALLQSDPQT